MINICKGKEKYIFLACLCLCLNSVVLSDYRSGYFSIGCMNSLCRYEPPSGNIDFTTLHLCTLPREPGDTEPLLYDSIYKDSISKLYDSLCIEEVDLIWNFNEESVSPYGMACIDYLGLDYDDRTDTVKLDSIFKINNNKVSDLNYTDTLYARSCDYEGYMVVKTYEGYYVHIVLINYNLGGAIFNVKYYWWYDTELISPIIHNSKQKYVDPIKIIKMKEGLELSWQPFPGYINLCLYNNHGIKLKSYEVCAQSGKKFLDYGKMSLGQGVYFLRVKPSNIVFPIIICK